MPNHRTLSAGCLVALVTFGFVGAYAKDGEETQKNPPATAKAPQKPVATPSKVEKNVKPAVKEAKSKPAIAKPAAITAKPAAVATTVADDASTNELKSLLKNARDHFAPTSPADIEQVKKQLRDALALLDGYLQASGANGQAWKRYLLWDELTQAIEQPISPTQIATLEGVRDQFVANYPGLELGWFTNARWALEEYLNRARAATIADPKTQYEAQLAAIAAAVDAAQPTTEQYEKLGLATGRLQHAGRAAELVAAIRRRFSRPNLYFQTSSRIVTSGIDRQVNDVAPLSDNILGTQITGTGHTVGQVQGFLIEDPNRAVIETVLTGVNASSTIGRNGPAIVYSRGNSQLRGVKQLVIDGDGMHALPATSKINTETVITGVASTKHGVIDRLVKKIAWKRIPQQKAAGERVASEHAERMLNRRLDDEAGPMIIQANADYQRRFRWPLIRIGQFPRLAQFSTTRDYLHLKATQSADSRFGAPSAPPEVPGKPEMAMRLHESLVNNFTSGVLSGQTLTQAGLEQISLDLLGKVPDELKPDEVQEPWSITFAPKDPISLRIGDKDVAITVRGERYMRDNKHYDAMYITARYKLENSARGVKAVRQGELEIKPPVNRPLGTRDVVFKRLLGKRFGKIFPPEMASKQLRLQGAWAKAPPLIASQAKAAGGWLLVTWEEDRSPPATAEDHAPPAIARAE